MSKGTLRDELRSEMSGWDHRLAETVDDDTPLISSGHLDSFNLVRLLVWVEGEIGRPIDATKLDLATEWDTVDLIVMFVERQRATA